MDTNKTYYWRRIGFVEIEDESGKMRRYGGSHDGLDFKFDIKYAGDVAIEFTVGILGLNRETIQVLTVWDYALALQRARKIIVYAGYEKDGKAQPIARGIITHAIPTSPPEMWLNFKCLIGNMGFDPVNGQCLKNKTVSEILSLFANERGMESRWAAKETPAERKVPKFYTGKSPMWTISEFAASQNVHIYIDDNVLTAVDKYAWRTKEVIKAAEVVNMQTGLLSIGNIDMVGATIKRRLDVRSNLMTWIRIESVIMPSANDYYYVIGKRHTGHYRGDEWTTELQTIRRVHSK